jgi:hypothetical protein
MKVSFQNGKPPAVFLRAGPVELAIAPMGVAFFF